MLQGLSTKEIQNAIVCDVGWRWCLGTNSLVKVNVKGILCRNIIINWYS
jgi:hypothetical protein